MKVRVPKELRPPNRHEFDGELFMGRTGRFRVTGKFRYPREGELFWYGHGSDTVGVAQFDFSHERKVILERVS